MELPLIHMHVPKCGGTSLLVLFRSWFGKNVVRKNDYPRETDYHRKVLSGHFPYNDKYSEFKWVTFVRHPISRLESFYRYKTGKLEHRHNPLNDDYWAKFIYQKTLEQWLDCDESKNLMVKQFAGKRPQEPLESDDLEKAKRAVDNFYFIGFQETYSDDVTTLANLLGVEVGKIPHHLKTAETKQRIYKNTFGNEEDLKLYNYILSKRLFQR